MLVIGRTAGSLHLRGFPDFTIFSIDGDWIWSGLVLDESSSFVLDFFDEGVEFVGELDLSMFDGAEVVLVFW